MDYLLVEGILGGLKSILGGDLAKWILAGFRVEFLPVDKLQKLQIDVILQP